MSTSASLPVPVSRLSRLARLGSLASGIAAGMVGEGMRQLAGGQRPRLGDLLLTPANARRVADQLAHLRGAAMKVGQLLSMDAGELLPPELREILARLREGASLPIYAIGGMAAADIADARRHGAQGIAAIRGLWPAM